MVYARLFLSSLYTKKERLQEAVGHIFVLSNLEHSINTSCHTSQSGGIKQAVLQNTMSKATDFYFYTCPWG